ncbi:MAG: PID-CTERM protein-sorting domain-containing protein [Ginsengibacter sp.]
MKRVLKYVFQYCIFIVFFCTLSASIYAQGGPGGNIGDPACDPQCNCRPDGTWCPIDNGVYLLLLTGIGYGIKKLRDTRKISTPANA